MTWYEMDKQRLVIEYGRVKNQYPDFRLLKRGDQLVWQGFVRIVVGGVAAEPLEIRIVYPEAFPAEPPTVEVLNPQLDPADFGHKWHRFAKGNVCYVRPREWNIATSADEIVGKTTDWYYNYVAVKLGLVDRMPDAGRAAIE
jgi:ubiquitin-protein ligase